MSLKSMFYPFPSVVKISALHPSINPSFHHPSIPPSFQYSIPPACPQLTSGMDKELFKRAATIRHFEERLLALFSQGRLSGTVHTCIGQELCALAVIDSLQDGDWIFSNHRCH